MPKSKSNLRELIESYESRAKDLKYKSKRDNTIGEATRICLQQNLIVLEGVIEDLKLLEELEALKTKTSKKSSKTEETVLAASPDDRH